jgi:hypothetical protein
MTVPRTARVQSLIASPLPIRACAWSTRQTVACPAHATALSKRRAGGSSSSSRGSAESDARSVSFVSAVTARADVYISHYRQSDSGHTVTVEFELQNTAGDIELTQSDVNALQEAACDQIAAKIQDQLPDYDVNVSCVGIS